MRDRLRRLFRKLNPDNPKGLSQVLALAERRGLQPAPAPYGDELERLRELRDRGELRGADWLKAMLLGVVDGPT